MPRFQALFEVKFNVDMTIEAKDAEDAETQFTDIADTYTIIEFVDHGSGPQNEEVDWDSSLRPLKESPHKK